MGVELNHTLVMCRDKAQSSAFLAEILGRPDPTPFGPFLCVDLDNGVSMDFHETEDAISPQHYAFLISEDEFDEIFGRVRERGLTYWADPAKQEKGAINHHDGGRGVYFDDLDGHFLEIITRPYGSGS